MRRVSIASSKLVPCECHEQLDENRGVMFRVRDTGYGVLPEEKEKVFFRGYRGYASKQSPAWAAGQGLGLTIAKEIVEYMDGTLELQSPSGIGGFYPGTAVTMSFRRSREVGPTMERAVEEKLSF